MDTISNPRQWYPSPDREVSPRPWFLPLTWLAFIISTMLPRKTRVAIAVPALIFLVNQVRAISTGDNVKDFSRASFIFGFMLKFIDFGILTRDGEAYKVKDRKPSSEKAGNISKAPSEVPIEEGKSIWGSFKDSAELWLFTLRGVGWNWEVGGIPQREPQSRRCFPPVQNTSIANISSYFLFRTIVRIFGSYLAWDICKHVMGLFPYIQSTNRGSFFDEPLIDQVVLTWLHQLEAFCFINLPYQIGALLTVATGVQTPPDWPPLFGAFSDGYLVSRAWGRVWHQLLRKPLSILTPHVQRWLGTTSRGSKRTVSLLCSFTMSGFVHWSGALNCPWTPSSHGMFTYFIMQAPVVRLEDYIVDWGRQKGVKSSSKLKNLLKRKDLLTGILAFLKCFGYIWTVSWISFSMRYAARYQFEHGALSVHEPFKTSFIDYLVAKIKA